MNLQEALKAQYGVKLPLGPQDGNMRTFKIDVLRNGFLLRLTNVACFGSIIDGEYFIWCDDRVWRYESEHKTSKKISYEWLIWEGARSQLEAGKRLSMGDSERLALAVQRLEGWL